MNFLDTMKQVLIAPNPVIYFVEGTKDIFFGRVYSGAFLPFDGNKDSKFGLYYIANHNAFYQRIIERKNEITRLLSASDANEISAMLIPHIEKVISTKSKVQFEPLPLDKIKRETKKMKVSARPIFTSTDTFIVLKGGNDKKEDNLNIRHSFNSTSANPSSGLNFIYRNTQKGS